MQFLLSQQRSPQHTLAQWLCEENTECLWGLKEEESRDLSFFKTWNCSWNLLCAPPGCIKEEWVYFRLLIIAYYCYSIKCLNYALYASVEKHGFAMCSLSLWLYTAWEHENFTHVTSLNPQGINCLSLWVKLVIAEDFSLLHWSVPSSQVPPPLEQWHCVTFRNFRKLNSD